MPSLGALALGADMLMVWWWGLFGLSVVFELIDESVCVEGEREQGGEEVNKGNGGAVGTDVAAAVAGPDQLIPATCREMLVCL